MNGSEVERGTELKNRNRNSISEGGGKSDSATRRSLLTVTGLTVAGGWFGTAAADTTAADENPRGYGQSGYGTVPYGE